MSWLSRVSRADTLSTLEREGGESNCRCVQLAPHRWRRSMFPQERVSFTIQLGTKMGGTLQRRIDGVYRTVITHGELMGYVSGLWLFTGRWQYNTPPHTIPPPPPRKHEPFLTRYPQAANSGMEVIG